MKKLLILLILPAQLIFAQNEVTLDSCYYWARENYPNLKQSEIWQEITSLKQENIKTSYLPQVTLNGQASYQSDVTKVDISVPGISIPEVSKDQYKAYAEVKQNIWDGGISEASVKLEDAVLQINLSQLEVELYRLNEQISQTFFTALAIDKQKEVLAAQKKVIEEKLKKVQSGIQNQVVEKSAALELEAEILNIEQNEIQLESGRKTALSMISILTGRNIATNVKLQYKPVQTANFDGFQRPEVELFLAQNSQFVLQSELLTKNRNPKLFGFGQAGYGSPGLNMLNDKFDTYYLVGVGLSWNAFDWKKTNRQKEMLLLQSDMISQQEETFNQNMELLLVQQTEQISKLENLLNSDSKMVSLRSDIAKASASKLENETITTSDYIQDLQAETIAKLNIEIHRIQLNEAKEKYNIIKGKSIQ